MQFLNMDTGLFQQEHPLDQYYRELYLQERRKKLERLKNQQVAGEGGGNGGGGAFSQQAVFSNSYLA